MSMNTFFVGGDEDDMKPRGRGFEEGLEDNRYTGEAGKFESLDERRVLPVVESVEGYVLYVGNVHMEAQEDDINDIFSEFGEVKQVHLNLDKRTGYCRGYALVQMAEYVGARDAVNELNGHLLLQQPITVDWAFKKK